MTESRALPSVLIDLMKLRVVVLLQVTAICAILVHDLLVRYGSIAGDRSWVDTAVAVAITAASASPCVRARVRVQIIDAAALQLWRLFEQRGGPGIDAFAPAAAI